MLVLQRKKGDSLTVGPLLLTVLDASLTAALVRVTQDGRWLADLRLYLLAPPRPLPLPGCSVGYTRNRHHSALAVQAPREIPIVRTDARLTVPR